MELLCGIGLVVLGVVLTLMAGRLSDHYTLWKQKQEALNTLDRVFTTVK